jgi:hypothetical protein
MVEQYRGCVVERNLVHVVDQNLDDMAERGHIDHELIDIDHKVDESLGSDRWKAKRTAAAIATAAVVVPQH